jgi:hypothetical protein
MKVVSLIFQHKYIHKDHNDHIVVVSGTFIKSISSDFSLLGLCLLGIGYKNIKFICVDILQAFKSDLYK